MNEYRHLGFAQQDAIVDLAHAMKNMANAFVTRTMDGTDRLIGTRTDEPCTIEAIKALRAHSGMGLKDSKDVIDVAVRLVAQTTTVNALVDAATKLGPTQQRELAKRLNDLLPQF